MSEITVSGNLLKKNKIFMFLVLLLFLRILLALILPITGDEAYHVEWARHLDWCYYDHPGMVAWIMNPFMLILGRNILSVRFQAVIAGILYGVVCYKLASEMFPGTEINIKGLFITGLVPLTAIGSVLVSTDTPLTVFWGFAVWFFYRAAEYNRLRDWILTGVFLGLAFLSKFLAFGFLPAAFLYLVMHKDNRKLLKTPGPWIALAITLVLFLPVLIWNYYHDWLTFRFNFISRQKELSFSIVTFLQYCAGQLIFFSPVVIIVPLIYVLKNMRTYFQNKKNLFLILFAGVPLCGFAFISFFREIGGHWTAIVLVPLVILFLRIVSLENYKFYKSGLISAACISGFIYMGIVLIMAAGPVRMNNLMTRLKAPKAKALQFSGMAFGNKDIAGFTERLATGNKGFCATKSYALSSILSFYSPLNYHYYLWASKSFYGRNYYIWDKIENLKGKTMNLVVFRNRISAAFIERIYPHFSSLAIHYFNEVVPQELINNIDRKNASLIGHKAPFGCGAFVIIVGRNFSGEDLIYETN